MRIGSLLELGLTLWGCDYDGPETNLLGHKKINS
jgi:hypothetical protein